MNNYETWNYFRSQKKRRVQNTEVLREMQSLPHLENKISSMDHGTHQLEQKEVILE